MEIVIVPLSLCEFTAVISMCYRMYHTDRIY